MQVEAHVGAWVSRAHMDMAVRSTMMAWTILCAGHAVDDKIDLQEFRQLNPIRSNEPVWQRRRRGELAVVFGSGVVTLLAQQSMEHRRGLGFQATLASGLRDLVDPLGNEIPALVKRRIICYDPLPFLLECLSNSFPCGERSLPVHGWTMVLE